jgi:hypothetical protein
LKKVKSWTIELLNKQKRLNVLKKQLKNMLSLRQTNEQKETLKHL